MLYFKKSELAEMHHISEKTVTNWIREAKDGKLALELHEEQGKAWIANTTKNKVLIEQLVNARKKYRNSRGVKEISPKPEFYKIYTEEQIFDIISNLEIRHEIPFQYSYFDGGATYWDKYSERLDSETVSNVQNATIRLLRMNLDYIDNLLRRYNRINVVDVGSGNAIPAKGLLEHLLEQGKLGRYIALDISPDMLRIAERNIQSWFGERVQFQAFKADINYDRFIESLMEDAIGQEAQSSANLVLAFGDTLSNLRSPDGALKIIHDSMGRNDLIVYAGKLDTEEARRYFDFGVGNNSIKLPAQDQMVLDLLSLDSSCYDVEIGYDAERGHRYNRIRLKVELTIGFMFKEGRRTVTLHKNDTILLWRCWHLNAQDVEAQLSRTDFDVLQSSLTEDKDYLLTISRVKRES